MSRREELLELDEDLRFRKQELFHQEFITTKPSLISRIGQIISRTEGQISRLPDDDIETRRYLEAKKANLQKFQYTVESTPLFESLDDWWCYEFTIGSLGTTLHLRHVALAEISGDEDYPWLSIEEYDARFKLIETKCEFLTTDEFAEERGVAPATIRVWIRRGKIRSAMKIGNRWMVPELTPPIKRGFTSAKYEWDVCLGNTPAGWERISKPGMIMIHQSSDKGKYVVWYYSKDRTVDKDYILDGTETEKLELYLIGQPTVEYTGDQEIIRQ